MHVLKWAVLFSNFVIRILNVGLRKSFGVFLLPQQEQFHEDGWLIGMIVSISVSIGDFIGPVVGGLSKRIGCRIVVILGGILFTSGLILAALSTTIIPLTFCLCFIVGLGYDFTNDVSLAVLGWYFTDRFSQANSVASFGGTFGMTLLGPLTALFIDLYGWRGAMFLLGTVTFHVTALGAVLRDPRKADTLLNTRDKKSYEAIESDDKKASGVVQCWQTITQSLDVSLFKEPSFLSIVLITTIGRFTTIAWIIYLVPNVISKGVSSLRGSLISTTAGIGSGVGMLMPGILDSLTSNSLSSTTLWMIAIAILSLSLVLDALVESYTGMLILGAWQGFGVGMMHVTNNVVLYEEFGKDRLANSLGWVRGISGFGHVLGGIMPGWIYQTTNSYSWSFVIIGVTQALAIVIQYLGNFALFFSCTKSSNNK